jgi:hypothetical protein
MRCVKSGCFEGLGFTKGRLPISNNVTKVSDRFFTVCRMSLYIVLLVSPILCSRITV